MSNVLPIYDENVKEKQFLQNWIQNLRLKLHAESHCYYIIVLQLYSEHVDHFKVKISQELRVPFSLPYEERVPNLEIENSAGKREFFENPNFPDFLNKSAC